MFQTNPPRTPAEPILEFLQLVANINSWVHYPSLDKNVCYQSRETGEISFFVRTKREVPSARFVYVRIDPHYSLPTYLLTVFNVKGEGLMPAIKVLNHYAKRIATATRDGDAVKKDVHHCWTIDSARSIESLFRSYDQLAKMHNCLTVFNLPK